MRRVLGYGLIGAGSVMALGILLNLGSGHSWTALLLGTGLFCVAPIWLGRLLLGPPARPQLVEASEQAWESELMRLAERRGGGLTVAEAVAHADLEAGRAEALLDRLCQKGLAEHTITGDGQILYRIQSAPSVEAKHKAEGVLDE